MQSRCVETFTSPLALTRRYHDVQTTDTKMASIIHASDRNVEKLCCECVVHAIKHTDSTYPAKLYGVAVNFIRSFNWCWKQPNVTRSPIDCMRHNAAEKYSANGINDRLALRGRSVPRLNWRIVSLAGRQLWLAATCLIPRHEMMAIPDVVLSSALHCRERCFDSIQPMRSSRETWHHSTLHSMAGTMFLVSGAI